MMNGCIGGGGALVQWDKESELEGREMLSDGGMPEMQMSELGHLECAWGVGDWDGVEEDTCGGEEVK